MNEVSSSAEQIIEEYRRRDRELPADFYSLHHVPNLYMRVGQLRGLAWALKVSKLAPLADRKILEVGCGRGNWLAIYESFDAKRVNLAGIELHAGHAEETRQKFPTADIRAGDATRLPWNDGQFDIVFQSLMFTSILDDQMKQAIAREMVRVCKPGGAILWYDFNVNNPNNPHVRGVKRREIAALFPDCTIRLRRLTLAPPIVRRLAGVSWLGCELLEKLSLLNTHYFGVLRKTV